MFIILEGIDRSGKSTVAKYFQSKGFQYIHFAAPDKKYNDPTYLGASYFDDMVELYSNLTGQDVVFDRSVWGEMVWPYVYKRRPQLGDADLTYLRDLERDNGAQHYLLVDPDREAHWARCVANKEPLTRDQFDKAYVYYERMALTHGFEVKDTKAFYKELTGNELGKAVSDEPKIELMKPKLAETPIEIAKKPQIKTTFLEPSDPVRKLEEANAINDILSNRILKKKGDVFEIIESDIRGYLSNKLNKLLGSNVETELSNEEIQVLKVFVQRIKEKEGAK